MIFSTFQPADNYIKRWLCHLSHLASTSDQTDDKRVGPGNINLRKKKRISNKCDEENSQEEAAKNARLAKMMSLSASQMVMSLPASQMVMSLPAWQMPTDGDVLISLADGDVHISQSVGDVPVSQSVGDVPVSQSYGDVPVSQSDGGIPVSLSDYDVCVSQSDKVPVKLRFQNSIGILIVIGTIDLLVLFVSGMRIVSQKGSITDKLSHLQTMNINTKEMRQYFPTQVADEAVRQCKLCINHSPGVAHCKTCKLNICTACNNLHKKYGRY
ncbi:unnamed protein product [Mytilus coruscus]|uniref:Uncharacterized protein n=1 Tax=Mytilus coruscus TaxID=42192 RepID=A0A6J8CG64_MYTCO|nr:unnamed protein product [Mytilus coruscus]